MNNVFEYDKLELQLFRVCQFRKSQKHRLKFMNVVHSADTQSKLETNYIYEKRFGRTIQIKKSNNTKTHKRTQTQHRNKKSKIRKNSRTTPIITTALINIILFNKFLRCNLLLFISISKSLLVLSFFVFFIYFLFHLLRMNEVLLFKLSCLFGLLAITVIAALAPLKLTAVSAEKRVSEKTE